MRPSFPFLQRRRSSAGVSSLQSFASKALVVGLGVSSFGLFGSPAKALGLIGQFTCGINNPANPTVCNPANPLLLGDKLLSFKSATLTPPGATAPVDVSYSWADTDGVADTNFADDVWLFEVKTAQPSFGPFELIYSYDITVVDSPNYYFNQMALEVDSNFLTPGSVVFKEGKSGTEVGTLKSTNGQADGPVVYTFIGDYKTITITDTVTVPAGASVTSVSNAWTQRERVPGPLPILGAAAAFGYSRKIRRRIKQVA
jgi:hypothetical protein